MDICFNNLMGNQLPRLEVIAHGPGDALLRYVMDTVKITDMKNILNSRNGEIGIRQRKKSRILSPFQRPVYRRVHTAIHAHVATSISLRGNVFLS